MNATVALAYARAIPVHSSERWTACDRRARLRQLARRIHTLGPRPLYELLVELDDGAELWPTLEAYGRLERFAGFIGEHGGDRLPGPRVVDGGRKS